MDDKIVAIVTWTSLSISIVWRNVIEFDIQISQEKQEKQLLKRRITSCGVRKMALARSPRLVLTVSSVAC